MEAEIEAADDQYAEQVQLRTYANAVNDARTIVILHTDFLLNQNDFVSIQGQMYRKLFHTGSVLPNVVKTSMKQGVIILTLQNQDEIEIFEREIPLIKLEPDNGGKLKVLSMEEYSNLHRINCRVSDDHPQSLNERLDEAKAWLLQQNRSLQSNTFTVVRAFARRGDGNGGTLKLRGNTGFLNAIKALNWSPYYGIVTAFCYLLDRGEPDREEQQAAAENAGDKQQQ